MEEILHQFTRFYTSQVVQDFFHQQYDNPPSIQKIVNSVFVRLHNVKNSSDTSNVFPQHSSD